MGLARSTYYDEPELQPIGEARLIEKIKAQCPVPPIEMADGDRLWDVRDLDRWIDSLKNDFGDDANAIVARLE
jgi:hypothetical protein